MKTLRHTLTTLSLGLGLLLTGAASLTLGGCQDDLFPGGPGGENAETGTRGDLTSPGNLHKEGSYWVANGRVPLVGVGRVIDDLNPGLVSISGGQSSFNSVTDYNLDNAASLDGITITDVALTPIFSVKDMYRTYAGNQTVGFVLGKSDGGSLLNAEVLGMMAIVTYRNNDESTRKVYNLSSEGSLLNVGLISTSSGDTRQTLSVKVTEPFDEVMLCLTGAEATIGKGKEIYYAFVGETPEVKITNTEAGTFPKATIEKDWDSLISDENSILSPEPESSTYVGALLGTIPLIGGINQMKLDLGTAIAPGTEIGFVYRAADIADIALYTKITLTPYDANGPIEDEIYTQNGLLDIKVASGGGGKYALSSDSKKITALEIEIATWGSANLGGTSILRAYTRAPIVIDPTSYFTAPETVQTTSSSYRFMKPSEGTIESITITSNPGGLAHPVAPTSENPYWHVTGMEEGKTYEVEILFKGPNNDQFITTTTITHVAGEDKTCQTNYMTGEDYQIVKAGDYNGINIISTIQHPEYIIDTELDNYATSARLANVIDVSTIAAVEAKNGQIDASKSAPKRVGFTIAEGPSLLGLSALHFFTVTTYLDGQKVQSGVSAENNSVSLGLINTGNKSKVRVSINATQPFDCVALETAGVLTVLEPFNIYNAFYEDASCEENDVMEECSQLMTASLDNLKLNIDGFSGIQLQSVSSSLANIVDENGESSGIIYTVTNIGTFSVEFSFDEQPAGKWIGLMMREPEGILSADLLKNTTVEFIHADGTTETVKDETDGLLGLELIGFGEKVYIEAYPQQAYCGMKVTFGGITLAQAWEFYGLYTTKDMNNDGIADCEQPEEDTNHHAYLSTDTDHLCDASGEGVDISINIDHEGFSTDETYYLGCFSSQLEDSPLVIPVKLGTNKLEAANASQPLHLTTHGVYTLRLYNDESCTNNAEISNSPLLLYIHSNHTVWNGEGIKNSWNDWDNWTDGAPWTCTNVIIPGDLGDNYPILNANETNVCANLYIEDGGQLVNSFYLNYELAWVDVELDENRYYMLTSPLKETFSGDWFINSDANTNWTTFASLTEKNYPEQRTNPTVYQRLWSANAPVKNPSGYQAKDEVAPDETHWTPPYNGVAQEYDLGMGFSLMVKGGSGDNTFRFPKTHTEYNYFNLAGSPTGENDEIPRGEGTIGRFIYEGENNTATDGTITVPVQKPEEDDVTACLVGNPFVAHVNLASFMQRNGIGEVKVFDGNENNSLILVDGELLSASGNEVQYIKPMESFFVMNYTGYEVTYTADMLTAGGETRTRSASPAPAALRLAATLDGHTAHALLRVSPTASAGVVPGEDTKLLVEGEARPAVAIYTVADGRALDIQQVPADVRRIPLGFYLPGGGKADIRLTPQFTDPQWSDWFLLDLRTGQRRRLTPAAIDLHDVENGSSRYVLVKNEGELRIGI